MRLPPPDLVLQCLTLGVAEEYEDAGVHASSWPTTV